MGLHADRERAESFGRAADRYDRTRPSYPAELIDAFGPPGRCVDVGCGTGQLARLLAARGWDVIGVDVDERMAMVARSHGVDVDVTPFEPWRPSRAGFDLVVSAQAWHWIDPAVGVPKAASLLRDGGVLGLVWQSYGYEPAVRDVIREVVEGVAPALADQATVPFGLREPDTEVLDRALDRTLAGHFEPIEVREFGHGRSQSVDEWLEELTTHSPVALLAGSQREELLDRLGGAVRGVSGATVDVAYVVRVSIARRRPGDVSSGAG